MYSLIQRIRPHHLLFDAILISASLYASLFLRLGWKDFVADASLLTKLLPYFLVLRLGTFVASGVYDIIWRFISVRDAVKLFRAVALSSLLILACTYFINIGRLPRSMFLIDLCLVSILMGGSRASWRLYNERRAGIRLRERGRSALIYGCGVIGRSLATHITSNSTLGLNLVGFVDDSRVETGRTICGVKVLGTGDELERLLKAYDVDELIISIYKIPAEAVRNALQAARRTGVKVRIVRGESFHSSQVDISNNLRTIELADLLGRPQRGVDFEAVGSLINGQRVLVTGAGGSIGSELVKQIARFHPEKLFLLDHSEYSLYEIDRAIEALGGRAMSRPLLADLKDKISLRNIFEECRPTVVFHAAAYKHVHIVEGNPYSAVINNVGGTKNLIELSEEFGVKNFVQISTDKAVRPVGVMGATKRVCELMVTAAGQRSGSRYCSVRFGNVLGSSGSLIPLLVEQIQNGGPITITHKDMLRFFMLPSEAVSLVLRAATIASPGDVLILRMGEPVRILDVAQGLLELSGRTEEEIPIIFTGLRPGEKMFEELYLCGNELDTEDPDVVVMPKGDAGDFFDAVDQHSLSGSVDQLLRGANEADPTMVGLLLRIAGSESVRQEQPAAGNPHKEEAKISYG